VIHLRAAQPSARGEVTFPDDDAGESGDQRDLHDEVQRGQQRLGVPAALLRLHAVQLGSSEERSRQHDPQQPVREVAQDNPLNLVAEGEKSAHTVIILWPAEGLAQKLSVWYILLDE
jgi:hypothetical protein